MASALDIAKKMAIPGVIPLSIDNVIENFIISLNAIPSFKGFNGYKHSTCISINSQIVHGIPTNKPLEVGDIVTIDIGVSYKQNHTDAARTFVVGHNTTDEINRLISTAETSLRDGINKATANNTIGDISYAIQRVIEFNGYKTPTELGGHGIGLSPHEDPFIPNYGVAGSGIKLKPMMCLAIEPVVIAGPKEILLEKDRWTISSQSGSLSAHVEDTIVVMDNHPIILTKKTLDGKEI